MRLYVTLAIAVTALLGAVAVLGWRRWSRLDDGGRLIIAAVAVHFVTAVISMIAVSRGIRTRMIQEVPQLIGTVLTLLGFLRWQPRPWQRTVVGVATVALAAAWVVAQYLQGTEAVFSAIAGPLHATFICAAAGMTIVSRVLVTTGRWTGELWYWFAVGLMIDYGTEVLLAPMTANLFGFRDDLVRLGFYLHLTGSLIGYGLMSWALWRGGTQIALSPLPARRPVGAV